MNVGTSTMSNLLARDRLSPTAHFQHDEFIGGCAERGSGGWDVAVYSDGPSRPVRVLSGIQDGDNRKGLVNEEGEPKLAFHVLASMYDSIVSSRSSPSSTDTG